MSGGLRHPVLRALVYSHVWLGLGAALQVSWIDRLYFTSEWRLALFAGSGTVAIYGLMRALRAHFGPIAGPGLLQWYDANRRWVPVMVVVAAVVATLSVRPFLDRVVPVMFFPALISVAYVLPMRAVEGRVAGLRRVPFMKSIWIAVVWASVAVLLPLSLLVGPIDAWPVLLLFGVEACFVYALMIAFDIRDHEHDPAFLRTLPQLVGERVAKRCSAALMLMVVVLLILLILFAPPRNASVLGLILPAVGVSIAAYMVTRASAQRSEAFYLFWLDGTLVLVPLLGWVGIWV
ncbi:MAG: UbiA family prenyltransferase [Flavobacteriales bacterium]